MRAGKNIVTDLTNEYMDFKKYIVIHHVVASVFKPKT